MLGGPAASAPPDGNPVRPARNPGEAGGRRPEAGGATEEEPRCER